MEWFAYGLLALIGLLMSASAVYAFFWAQKTGEFRDLDQQARSIFDETEPEGVVTDRFPGRATRASARPQHAAAASKHS
ncbi:MAG: cbb3-type cytochrome oxidase assembly protein [Opitutaceae bacterium]|nr:cbb3-type cytochrome oxidase assembly protein [Opitutaceae bacterium]